MRAIPRHGQFLLSNVSGRCRDRCAPCRRVMLREFGFALPLSAFDPSVRTTFLLIAKQGRPYPSRLWNVATIRTLSVRMPTAPHSFVLESPHPIVRRTSGPLSSFLAIARFQTESQNQEHLHTQQVLIRFFCAIAVLPGEAHSQLHSAPRTHFHLFLPRHCCTSS